MIMHTNRVRTVTELTAELKGLLEGQFRFVSISGEISNLRTPLSGHSYFVLKDETAQIRAVLFKGTQRFLSEPLREGRQVVCHGRISVYEPRGEYQIIVDSVDQHGAGLLRQQFEDLKRRLAAEGLFEQGRKKTIPLFPRRVVVISSPTGAAIHDFLKIHTLRKSTVHVQIFPVTVQGAVAAGEIARAIERVNRELPCDLVVLCRGGGSIEDLWSFNEEVVARAICNSAIPVVTGVGHETDHTIADFCADYRAPTPTGAAEAIFPDSTELRRRVSALATALLRAIEARQLLAKMRVRQQKRHLRSFLARIENGAIRLDALIDRFHGCGRTCHLRLQHRLSALLMRLEKQAPLARIILQEQKIFHLRERLTRQMRSALQQADDALARNAALLGGVSPLATLARGYAIVQRADGTVVSDSVQVCTGDNLHVRLHRGVLECEVTGSRDGDETPAGYPHAGETD